MPAEVRELGYPIRKWRHEIFSKLRALKTPQDMLNFDTCMIQRNVEDALEQTNPVCSIQLRTIIYVHNQLVSYAKKAKIYLEDYGKFM